MNILILGAKGMLGGELRKVFPKALAWDRTDVDVTQIGPPAGGLRLKLERLEQKPEIVINCAAFNDVDGAEEKRDTAFALNAQLPSELATLCKELSIVLVHFSTNYVFDGERGEYKEDDRPSPLSSYAQSKYQGEVELKKNTDKFYIIRTSVLFGLKGESEMSKKSFVDIMLDLSQRSDTIKAVEDEINSITYIKDLAENVRKLILDKYPYGIYHITNSGQASWYELAKEIFTLTKKNISLIPVPSSEFPRKARRPKKSVLLNTKLPPIRPWQEALSEFLNLPA